jgi:hypothetical protein
VFAIEIEADAWLLYVVAAQLKPPELRQPSKNVAEEDDGVHAAEQDFEMFFFGPMLLGDTYYEDGAKRLVENICDVCRWARQILRTGGRELS